MKKLAFICVVAFGTTAMAADLALYDGPPNGGWYDAAQQHIDVQTIVDEVGGLFAGVDVFDDTQFDDFGAWIDDRIDDGKLDIIWLNGTMPSVLYPFPNLEPDGSRAEQWLDGGNMLINVADWFGYMSYEGGSRSADNGGTGAANILDLSSGVIVSADGTTLPVTAEGEEYMPSLVADDPVHSDRPVVLSAVQDPWEVVAIFAGTATQADPVVIHNTETDGYVALINQANLGNSVTDRGITSAEFIGNWVTEHIGLGGGGNPLARRPDPEDGAMLSATWGTLTWKPGYYAVSHDLYIGTNFNDVNDGAADTYVGNIPTAMQIVGFVGFPIADGLVPGTTYYWRVDEVNDADPNSPWKGDVWSFWVPPRKAYNPSPADGVGFSLTDATVSWTIGFNGKLSQMYFGTDAAEVEAGTGGTAKGPVVGTIYDPGPLEPGTTYYWRVDQFDGAETHTGDVWSLTTVPVIAVSDPALKAWWTLEEGAGAVVVDQSGHGNHGSFVGDIQWADGYQGTALEFAGGNSANPTYVNFGNTESLQLTGSITMSAWVRMNPGNAGAYMGIGGKLVSGTYKGYSLVRHSSNVFRLWCDDGAGVLAGHEASSDVPYTDTEWHHVAGVVNQTTSSLYVDGVKQAQQGIVNLTESGVYAYIGKQYGDNSSHRYWNGLIDDVRIYSKALTDAEIADVMLGDTKQAGSPVPGRDALLDIRDISSLSWSRGAGASSHDVYLGTDRDAVAGADSTAPESQGNQAGTSLAAASLVVFGGGDYYWRVDEVEAGGAVNAGTIWKFTVPDYLIVDNFESYNNIDPPNAGSNRVFDNWIDGYGTTTNGALVGNDAPPYGEHSIVKTGNQSMLYTYDNAGKTSEATLTLAKKRDWTVEGVTKLSLWLRGASANAPDKIYVALNGTAVVYHDDPAATQMKGWNEWVIDLAAFGVDLANVNSITIGVGTRGVAGVDQIGTLYFDDIRLIQ